MSVLTAWGISEARGFEWRGEEVNGTIERTRLRTACFGLALTGLILSGLAIVISAFILVTAHPPALIWDEWDNWSFLVDRGLWGSIYCRHNGHPMFVPNMLYRINAFAFAGDAAIRSVVTWSAAALSGVGLAALGLRGRGGVGSADWPSLAVAALVCAIMTCAALGREITWGMAIHDHLPTLGAIAVAFGLVGLLRNQDRVDAASIAAIVLGAALASFSFAFGLAVWGALPLVLALATRRAMAPILVLVAGVLISLWVMKFSPTCTPEVTLPPPKALMTMGFALSVAGAGVASLFFEAHDVVIAATLGVAASAAALWAIWIVWAERARTPALAGLLLVIWYGLGAALLAGIGRANFGVEASLHGRFYPISFLVFSALGLFAYVRLAQGGSRVFNLVGSGLIAGVAIAIVQFNAADVIPRQQQHALQLSTIHRVMLSNLASEEYVLAHRSPMLWSAAPRVLTYLRERRWDLFYDPMYLRLGTSIAASSIVSAACDGEVRAQSRAFGAGERRGMRAAIAAAIERGDLPVADHAPEAFYVFGWARHPDGQPANRIILTRDDVVVGFARPARHFADGFSPQRWSSATGLAKLFGTRHPDLAIALGLGAEFAGAARVGAGGAQLRTYAVGTDGSLCRLSVN